MRRGVIVVMILAAVPCLAGLGLVTNPPKPDLRYAELPADRIPTMEVPLRVKVHLKVLNFGPGNSESFTARLSYRKGSSGPWTMVREYPLPFSPPLGGAEWNPMIDLFQGGTYTFKVEMDPEHKIAETNEGNNTRTVTKTFPAGVPDLTEANVNAQVTRTMSSGAVYTRVTWDVRNIGDGKAAGSFVTVIKVSKNNAPFVELARHTRSNVQPGASTTFTDNHSFTSVTRLNFRIETDATSAIPERSTSNNSADSGALQI